MAEAFAAKAPHNRSTGGTRADERAPRLTLAAHPRGLFAGISEVTVKVHRSNLMRKMSVHSLPELGQMADKLKLVSEKT